jgi:hypothetical protein
VNAQCQIQIACDGARAVHSHHRKLRSQGGTSDPSNILLTCLDCHQATHANPLRSYSLGHLVHSWDNPKLIPIAPAEPSQGDAREPVSGIRHTAAGPGTFGFTADMARDGVIA